MQLQADPTVEMQQLQEELIACKLREAEANLSMKELRQRVTDLDKYWQVILTCCHWLCLPQTHTNVLCQTAQHATHFSTGSRNRL